MTAIWFLDGPIADPMLTQPVFQVSVWIEIWNAASLGEKRDYMLALHLDDPAHRYYECPDNNNIEDEEDWLSTTVWVAKFVRNKSAFIEVMWARALALASGFPAFPNDRPTRLTAGNFNAATGRCGGIIYTDGSGGKKVPQIVSQVGAATATCKVTVPDGDLEKLVVQHSSIVATAVLGGQTVPRGEAFAIATALAETRKVKGCGIDAVYAIRGLDATQGEDSSKLKTLLAEGNGDIWQQVLEAGRRQQADYLQISQIAAHSSFDRVVEGTLPIEHFLGNALVDAGSSAIAKERGLTDKDAKEANQRVGQCKQIAFRLPLVEARCRCFRAIQPPSAEEVSAPQPISEGLGQAALRNLIDRNSHALVRCGSKIRCAKCGAKHAINRPERWLHSVCETVLGTGIGVHKRKAGHAFKDVARRLLAAQPPQTQVELGDCVEF